MKQASRQPAVYLSMILVAAFYTAGILTPASAKADLPKSLPKKIEKPIKKKNVIDFTGTNSTGSTPPPSQLDKVLQRSVIDLQSSQRSTPAPTKLIVSRKTIAAPPGDLAEPLSAFTQPPKTMTPLAAKKIETPVVLAPIAIQPFEEFEKPQPNPPRVLPQKTQTLELTFVPETIETPVIAATATEPHHVVTAPQPATQVLATVQKIETMAFLRAGYLDAHYKKFDDRMKNTATSLGFGVAREFDTSIGSFEARAAIDAYHAMDQSVTIDNIRMLSLRTEVAYWLSTARVKPSISLGLGWVDYSIRSYRSVGGIGGSEDEKTVVLRTHAKSRAFSIIPASSLRVELGHGLVVDTQTEFIALLGGESSDAAQGFGVTVGLGWIF